MCYFHHQQQQKIGTVTLLVNNLVWVATSLFHNVIEKFRKIFHIGKENQGTFTYVRINLKQTNDKEILVNQLTYFYNLQTTPLYKETNNCHLKVTVENAQWSKVQ